MKIHTCSGNHHAINQNDDSGEGCGIVAIIVVDVNFDHESGEKGQENSQQTVKLRKKGRGREGERGIWKEQIAEIKKDVSTKTGCPSKGHET